MNNVYICPKPHDGSLKITFNKVLMPGGFLLDGMIAQTD